MTTSPEAFLAREAELCYSVMAHVTDYDVWHISEEPVSVEMVFRIINQNTETAQQAIRNLARDLGPSEGCDCEQALEGALTTDPQMISKEARQRLSLLLEKYLDK
jgi:5'-methylthioadenosine phosphorylase